MQPPQINFGREQQQSCTPPRKKAAGCFVPPQAARRSVGRAEHAEILISAEEEAERERLNREADEELARRKAEALAEAASSAE